jgi:hypothetical protein
VTSYQSQKCKIESDRRFQDGRRRHVGNSSACYKMGNYHPIFMKLGTQTKTDKLNSKMARAEMHGQIQDGRHHVGNPSEL